MEFKATLILDASPGLIGAVNNLVNALTGLKPSAPVSAPLVLAGEAVYDKLKTDSPDRIPSTEEVTPPADTPVETDPVSRPKYTKEQVKAAAAAKKDKREEMKKILDEMGAKSIPTLSEDQYEEFMQRISVL